MLFWLNPFTEARSHRPRRPYMNPFRMLLRMRVRWKVDHGFRDSKKDVQKVPGRVGWILLVPNMAENCGSNALL